MAKQNQCKPIDRSMLIRVESIDMQSCKKNSPDSPAFITVSVAIKTTVEKAEKYMMISNLSKEDLEMLIETRL